MLADERSATAGGAGRGRPAWRTALARDECTWASTGLSGDRTRERPARSTWPGIAVAVQVRSLSAARLHEGRPFASLSGHLGVATFVPKPPRKRGSGGEQWQTAPRALFRAKCLFSECIW